MEKDVEVAEATAGIGHRIGHGGESGEFSVDEPIDDRHGSASVRFLGGFLALHERVDRNA